MKIAATFQHSLQLLFGKLYANSTPNKPVAQKTDFKNDLIYKILSIQAERYLPYLYELITFFSSHTSNDCMVTVQWWSYKKILFALKSELEDFYIPPTPQSPTPFISVSLCNISFFVAQLLTAFSLHIQRIEAKKNEKPKGYCGSQISKLKAVKGDQVHNGKLKLAETGAPLHLLYAFSVQVYESKRNPSGYH